MRDLKLHTTAQISTGIPVMFPIGKRRKMKTQCCREPGRQGGQALCMLLSDAPGVPGFSSRRQTERGRQVRKESTSSELGEEEEGRSTGGTQGQLTVFKCRMGVDLRDTHQSPETTSAPGCTQRQQVDFRFAHPTGALASRGIVKLAAHPP